MGMINWNEVVKATDEIISAYPYRLTVRQIYYRLISPPYQLFAGTQKNYKYFDKVLTKARERGEVDWHRIEDRARTTLGGDSGFNDPNEFLKDRLESLKESWEYYARPMWDNQPTYIEIWVEKDALASLFHHVARRYNVLVYPSRGYSSFTRVMEALESRLVPRWAKGQNWRILQFTDHDPSGIDMMRDIHDRIDRYYPNIQGYSKIYYELEKQGKKLTWRIKRVALTYDQVEQFNLAPNPTKQADPRSADYVPRYGNQCWELDALPPEELEEIIARAIEAEIDADKWNETIKLTKEEQEKLKERLSRMRIEWDEE